MAMDADASNENSTRLFVVRNMSWYNKFTTLLNQEAGRRADLALRKFQKKAAERFGTDPAAFRNLLICLLEEVVFRIQLISTGLPYELLLATLTRYDRDIKAAERCRREMGEPIRLPNALLQVMPLEMSRRAA